jgi:hypothetical protein
MTSHGMTLRFRLGSTGSWYSYCKHGRKPSGSVKKEDFLTSFVTVSYSLTTMYHTIRKLSSRLLFKLKGLCVWRRHETISICSVITFASPPSCPPYCHMSCIWLQSGFGLVNRLIDYLHVVTTNNYNTIAISTLYSSLENTVLSLLLDVSR